MITPRTDIGVNLLHKRFNRDREDVIARAHAAGVAHMLVTCTDLQESAQGIAFCRDREHGFWCTAGVHPHHAKDTGPDWVAELTAQAANPQVKAVGEAGLDFNRDYSPRARQIEVFRAQLEVAAAVGKPVFVHERESGGTVAAMLGEFADELTGAVVHCFTGTREELGRYLDAGFHIGITGWLCDERRGQPLRDLVTDIPLDRLLVETDAPFLRPHNAPPDPAIASDKRRNEPALLNYVIEVVAQLHGREPAEVAAITHRNASIVFGLTEDS